MSEPKPWLVQGDRVLPVELTPHSGGTAFYAVDPELRARLGDHMMMMGTALPPWTWRVDESRVSWMTDERAEIEQEVVAYRRTVESSLSRGEGLPE